MNIVVTEAINLHSLHSLWTPFLSLGLSQARTGDPRSGEHVWKSLSKLLSQCKWEHSLSLCLHSFPCLCYFRKREGLFVNCRQQCKTSLPSIRKVSQPSVLRLLQSASPGLVTGVMQVRCGMFCLKCVCIWMLRVCRFLQRLEVSIWSLGAMSWCRCWELSCGVVQDQY